MPDFPGLGDGSGPAPEFFSDSDDDDAGNADLLQAEGEVEGTVSESETPVTPALEGDESVPFHEHPRWKKLIQERNEDREKLQRFEPYAPLLEDLQAQNLPSAQAVREAIARQQQEEQQRAAQAAQAALYQRLQQQVDAGDITVAEAERDWLKSQQELADSREAAREARITYLETERQWEAVQKQYPYAEREAALALAHQRGVPLAAAAASLHRHVEGLVNQNLTRAQAKSAAAAKAPVPERGGQAPPAREKAASRQSGEFSWMDILDGKR